MAAHATQSKARRARRFLIWAFECAQSFLRDRGDEHPILGVDVTEVQTATAGGARALCHVEHPLVGSNVLMEPHGMVEASNDELVRQKAVPVVIKRAL
jgi:hypothetical protein